MMTSVAQAMTPWLAFLLGMPAGLLVCLVGLAIYGGIDTWMMRRRDERFRRHNFD